MKKYPKNGLTPIEIACSNQSGLNVVSILIEGGAKVNTTKKNKKSSLHYACYPNPDFGVIKLLVENGIEVNKLNENNETPLHLICKTEDHQGARFLLNNGAEVNVKDSFQRTPLHNVCETTENIKIVKCLLNHGVNIDLTNKLGETAISHVTEKKLIALLNNHRKKQEKEKLEKNEKKEN
ncbi:ankyrin repeat-containing protein [Anaeramoeba flamelloides]|uniref:Ankyrin repeat-containing protein n=1 Tax=Anaeramoeba flamelloides TaxID=1746091 RepID=A0ABQ8Y6K9_9EUKA|nr:ankyrin repeat-containing protein [Anaeramoeba flamelloides]